MRVVAGTARGRKLSAPPGSATRPTSDRVREATMAMLVSMDAIDGATVADLFAGSGALGIECLSRGAESAVFVDHAGPAVATIRSNLEVLGPDRARATVVRADALGWAATMDRHDLVFADPPYGWGRWADLLDRLAPRTGLLVAETAWSGEGDPWTPGPGWETVKARRYGGTVVVIAQPLPVPSTQGPAEEGHT